MSIRGIARPGPFHCQHSYARVAGRARVSNCLLLGSRYSSRSGNPGAPPPSFSSQRESRAQTMRRHGHGNKYSTDGRQHRTLRFPFGTTFITMKIVHFHLHVSPQRATPSFSSQRESRAQTMRRSGHGNKYSADGRRHRTLPFPFSKTFITMKIVHFHLHVWPHWAIRHSRRNGNPEPRLCAGTVMATNIRRMDGGIAPCAFPSAQPSLHTTRTPDSHCGKNDGGFEDNQKTLTLGTSSEGGSAAMNAPPS